MMGPSSQAHKAESGPPSRRRPQRTMTRSRGRAMASGMLAGASPKSATRVALRRRKAARPDQTTWAWRSTRWPVRTAQ
eukprot:7764190-Alexandrium_andersonii.AAC.1